MRNTNLLLDFLQNSEDVSWVQYPSLPDHPDYEQASRMLPKEAGSIIVSVLAGSSADGGHEAGAAFINLLACITSCQWRRKNLQYIPQVPLTHKWTQRP